MCQNNDNLWLRGFLKKPRFPLSRKSLASGDLGSSELWAGDPRRWRCGDLGPKASGPGFPGAGADSLLGRARSGPGEGFRHPRTPGKGHAAASPCGHRGAGALAPRVPGWGRRWVAAASGRLQRRGGGAAHLVAEEAGEAALGGGGARRRGAREPAHVPEAQRAVVRGRVQHLAVHLRARGGAWAGARLSPPPAPGASPSPPPAPQFRDQPRSGPGIRVRGGVSAQGTSASGRKSRPRWSAGPRASSLSAPPSGAYLDAVDDERVAAEHPLQRPGLGVEGARAGVAAAREHCGHTRHWPAALHVARTPRGRGQGVRVTGAPSGPHPPTSQGCSSGD